MKKILLLTLILFASACATTKIPDGVWRISDNDVQFCFKDAGKLKCSSFPRNSIINENFY